MHGLFMAGHLLAALQHEIWQVPFEVLMMHCLAHQPSAGWTSSNSTAIIVGDQSNDVAAVRVGAVAQVFSHLAHSALKRHGHVRSAKISGDADTCGVVQPKFSQSNASCLQSVVFGGPAPSDPMTFVVLNRCESVITITLAGNHTQRHTHTHLYAFRSDEI